MRAPTQIHCSDCQGRLTRAEILYNDGSCDRCDRLRVEAQRRRDLEARLSGPVNRSVARNE